MSSRAPIDWRGAEAPARTACLETAAGPTRGAAVEVADAASPDLWDAYVSARPDATVYHRACWRQVFEEAFGHECHYVTALRSGRVVGVLPMVAFRSALFGRFAVSLPFVNYGGVLADDEEVAAALEERALRLAGEHRWKFVELRHFEPRYPRWPAKRHKVTMELALPHDEERLWAGFDRKARNQVRKAEKSGLDVGAGGAELLPEFYRVFARNMRDLGTPVYSPRFFEAVVRALGPGSRVFIVRHAGEPIAGSLTVSWRDRVEVPWASSLREHNDKSPNNLLYMAMLRYALGAGARVFDFGRSTPNEGTFQFKKQWGAEPRPLVWEYAGLAGDPPDHNPANPRFRAAIALWRRLPLRVSTLVGPHIVRHIP